MRRVAGAVVLVACGLVVGAGCSDDDAGREAASGATTTVLRFEGDPDSEFCVLLREVQVDEDLQRPSETAADLEEAYRQTILVLARAAERAPAELQTDVGLVLEGFVALDTALGAVGYSFDALEQSPGAAQIAAAVNAPAFRVARDRIEAYKAQVCRI